MNPQGDKPRGSKPRAFTNFATPAFTTGGAGGFRTHGTHKRTPDFKSGVISLSTTAPRRSPAFLRGGAPFLRGQLPRSMDAPYASLLFMRFSVQNVIDHRCEIVGRTLVPSIGQLFSKCGSRLRPVPFQDVQDSVNQSHVGIARLLPLNDVDESLNCACNCGRVVNGRQVSYRILDVRFSLAKTRPFDPYFFKLPSEVGKRFQVGLVRHVVYPLSRWYRSKPTVVAPVGTEGQRPPAFKPPRAVSYNKGASYPPLVSGRSRAGITIHALDRPTVLWGRLRDCSGFRQTLVPSKLSTESPHMGVIQVDCSTKEE